MRRSSAGSSTCTFNEGMGSHSIAVRLTDEGVSTPTGKPLWFQSRVLHILANASYRGTWFYGKYRHVATEDGVQVHEQPRDSWIEIPIPQVIDDATWDRSQALKKQRSTSGPSGIRRCCTCCSILSSAGSAVTGSMRSPRGGRPTFGTARSTVTTFPSPTATTSATGCIVSVCGAVSDPTSVPSGWRSRYGAR